MGLPPPSVSSLYADQSRRYTRSSVAGAMNWIRKSAGSRSRPPDRASEEVLPAGGFPSSFGQPHGSPRLAPEGAVEEADRIERCDRVLDDVDADPTAFHRHGREGQPLTVRDSGVRVEDHLGLGVLQQQRI
jgi:hypothetical protein